MTATRTLVSRGNDLREAGDIIAAGTLLRQAIADHPQSAEAHCALGYVKVLEGDYKGAIESFNEACGIKPDYLDAVLNCGDGLVFLGAHRQAIEVFRHAITIKPMRGILHNRLGFSLWAQAEHDRSASDRVEAEKAIREAIKLDPTLAEAHHNLAVILRDRQDLAGALNACDEAIRLVPEFPHAINFKGMILGDMGRYEEAIACHEAALLCSPDLAEVHNNLGRLYQMICVPDKGIHHCQEAIRLKPKLARPYVNLGANLETMSKWDAAILAYRHALQLDPNSPDALNNMAGALRESGRMEEAQQAYRAAMGLDPTPLVGSNLIFIMDQDIKLGSTELQAERRAWYERHKYPAFTTWANDRDPDRKLRVGYVSADFRRHSVAYTFSPVLWGHDREQFEVYCYCSTKIRDDMHQEFRQKADQYRDIMGTSDIALAQMIRNDGIDILVDLSGHTAGNRLRMFTAKPAPVSVTALGNISGTGVPQIDYLFSDPTIIPEDERHLYAETIYDLPCTFTYAANPNVAPVIPLPALRNGFVTFGCFNRLSKANDEVLALWARVLDAVPDSKIMFKDKALGDPKACTVLRNKFEAHGISRDRIITRSITTQLDHMAAYGEIDIALDPFPQNGGVTTLEGLWMGVPVITKLGATPPGRVGASVMQTLNMPGFVAADDLEYVNFAEFWATRGLQQLEVERLNLRPIMRLSPICDAAQLVANIEGAYRTMWQRWCGK